MKAVKILMLSVLAGVQAASVLAEKPLWLDFPAKEGTSNGKKIVLISGDEEYRSEESCPMLGKILSQRFGYDCRVLFTLDETSSYIDPNNHRNMPGVDALKDADLMIIGTRFRELSDEDYAHFADFLNAGKPVIGFRTATHAFTGKGKTGDFQWSQFGIKILGERWVSHHGRHKSQGARGVVEEKNAGHVVLSGVKDVFGPSDVYGVRNLDENKATVLLRGAVTETLEPTSKNIEGPKNDPMQAMAWLREYTAPNGESKGQAFCTTMGASNDFENEGFRRLVINAAVHLTGEKVSGTADVSYIDPFETTFFGFNKGGDYYKQRNLQVSDFVLGKSGRTGLASEKK